MKNVPEQPTQIAQDILALESQTRAISRAVEDLKKTGINEDVLVFIIQQSAKRFHSGTPISAKYIRFILSGIGNVDKYLFPDKYIKQEIKP